MKSASPLASALVLSTTPLTVCSGVSRRANASAVASEHWSTLARITSSRSRSACTG